MYAIRSYYDWLLAILVILRQKFVYQEVERFHHVTVGRLRFDQVVGIVGESEGLNRFATLHVALFAHTDLRVDDVAVSYNFV